MAHQINRNLVISLFLLTSTLVVAQNDAIIFNHNGRWNKVVMPLVIGDRVIDSTFESNHLMYLNKIHVNLKFINQLKFSDSLIETYNLSNLIRESYQPVDDSSQSIDLPGSFEILLIKENKIIDSLQTYGLNHTEQTLQMIELKMEGVASDEDLEKLKASFARLISSFDGPIYYELRTKDEE